LSKIKTRVEDVARHLNPKRVKAEKNVEFKKQVLANHKLKEYFQQNPQEKDVLLNDIKNSNVGKDKLMFKHLETLPSYARPQNVMAVSSEQLKLCSVGSAAFLPEGFKGSSATIATFPCVKNIAQPDNPALLIQNLIGLSSQRTEEGEVWEEPAFVSMEALEPTSGRKLWKMRHHKRVKKKEGRGKDGFQRV